MNEQSKPQLTPDWLLRQCEESEADIVAGRTEDFDAVLMRLRKRAAAAFPTACAAQPGDSTSG